MQQIERDCFSVAKRRSIYIYDVSISGFTRSSIYIYDISSLNVKTLHDGPVQELSIPKLCTKFAAFIIQLVASPVLNKKIVYGQESVTVQSVVPTLQYTNTY